MSEVIIEMLKSKRAEWIKKRAIFIDEKENKAKDDKYDYDLKIDHIQETISDLTLLIEAGRAYSNQENNLINLIKNQNN